MPLPSSTHTNIILRGTAPGPWHLRDLIHNAWRQHRPTWTRRIRHANAVTVYDKAVIYLTSRGVCHAKFSHSFISVLTSKHTTLCIRKTIIKYKQIPKLGELVVYYHRWISGRFITMTAQHNSRQFVAQLTWRVLFTINPSTRQSCTKYVLWLQCLCSLLIGLLQLFRPYANNDDRKSTDPFCVSASERFLSRRWYR